MKKIIAFFACLFIATNAMAIDNYDNNGGVFTHNVNQTLKYTYDDKDFKILFVRDKTSKKSRGENGRLITTNHTTWQPLTNDIDDFLEYLKYTQDIIQNLNLQNIEHNWSGQMAYLGQTQECGKIEYNEFLPYEFDWVITSNGKIYATLWRDTSDGAKCVGRFTDKELLTMYKNLNAAYAAWCARNNIYNMKQEKAQTLSTRIRTNITNY